MATLLTAFTTGKAAYDFIEPLASKLFTRLGWKKDDKRREIVSERMRDLVRQARDVTAKSSPEQAGPRLQSLVDKLLADLQSEGVPAEDAQIFADQAAAVLVMVAFGSIEEWYALRARIDKLETSIVEEKATAQSLKESFTALELKLRTQAMLAVAGLSVGACALAVALILMLRR